MQALLVFTATILVANLVTPTALADERNADNSGCTVANVAGSFGYVGTGTVRAANPFGRLPGEYSSLGILSFDGKGNLSIIESAARIDDFFFPTNTPYVGTYTVDRNCLGTMTITAWIVAGLPGPHFRLVFVDKGSGLRAIAVIPGVTVNYVNTTRIEKKD